MPPIALRKRASVRSTLRTRSLVVAGSFSHVAVPTGVDFRSVTFFRVTSLCRPIHPGAMGEYRDLGVSLWCHGTHSSLAGSVRGSPIQRSAWKGYSAKSRCLTGLRLIRLAETLCNTTTCSDGRWVPDRGFRMFLAS